jgi:hypothetical protein
MPDLTIQNIEQISRDIRMQEISFSHLADELIDHVCCDVEHEMQSGLGFIEAYMKVKGKIGLRRLKEIQEETLYAVDTKYRKMKNTMKISGVCGTVLLGFAALFKIMHWPGAGIMIMLGGVILAFVFMPSALVVLWKETHSKKRIFLYISAFVSAMFFILGTMFKIQHWPGAGVVLVLAGVSGILCFIPVLLITKLNKEENRSKRAVYIFGAAAFVFYITGLLFKIQHWPGAGILLVTALIVMFLVVFPWYTVLTWKDEANIKAGFLFMVIGSLAIVAPSSLISMNMQRNYEAGYYMNLQEQQAMFRALSGENNSFVKACSDTIALENLNQLVLKTKEFINVIDGIEAGMIAESEGEPGVPAGVSRQIIMTENGAEIQFNQLKRPFNPMPFDDFLKNGTSSRKELDKKISDYCTFIGGLSPAGELNEFIKLLDPSVFFPCSDSEEQRISLMSALHMTALLKNSVLAVESQALKTVVNR